MESAPRFEQEQEAPRETVAEQSERERLKREGDRAAAEVLRAIAEEQPEQPKHFELMGREHEVNDAWDAELARLQHERTELKKRIEEARGRNDYFGEQVLAKLYELADLEEDRFVRVAELKHLYPEAHHALSELHPAREYGPGEQHGE